MKKIAIVGAGGFGAGRFGIGGFGFPGIGRTIGKAARSGAAGAESWVQPDRTDRNRREIPARSLAHGPRVG